MSQQQQREPTNNKLTSFLTSCFSCPFGHHRRRHSSSSYHSNDNMAGGGAQYSQFHHISQITDSLYLTSAYGASSPTACRAKGITCVVNATLSFQAPTPKYDPGMEFIRVPVDDVPSANISVYFERVADKIYSVKKKSGRCLVHCYAGRSRSATLVIVYLMKYEGMNLRKAYHFVKTRRVVIRPNPGFWKQMIHYEQLLRGAGGSSVKMVQSSIGWVPDIYKEEMKDLVW